MTTGKFTEHLWQS